MPYLYGKKMFSKEKTSIHLNSCLASELSFYKYWILFTMNMEYVIDFLPLQPEIKVPRTFTAIRYVQRSML